MFKAENRNLKTRKAVIRGPFEGHEETRCSSSRAAKPAKPSTHRMKAVCTPQMTAAYTYTSFDPTQAAASSKTPLFNIF